MTNHACHDTTNGMMAGAGVGVGFWLVRANTDSIADYPAPKTTLNHKILGKWGKWENDTSNARYIKACTVFPYFRQMGKWGKCGENE